MRKIALIIPDLKRGGAERVMSLLYRQLSLEHEVYMIIYNGPVEYEVNRNLINLNLPNNGNRWRAILNVIRRTLRLRKQLKRIKPDLTISFIGNIQPILSLLPVVVSIRIDLDYSDEFNNRRMNHLLLKTIYRFPNVKKIVAVSRAIENKLSRSYGFKNLTTIYNPIDFGNISALIEGTPPVSIPYIVAVGSFKTQNGFDILIKAFEKSGLAASLKLIVVGDGAGRKDLELLVKELDLQQSVLLPGKTTNPYIYMAHAEFFVLSSRFEGFPNVLIEALACGAACIATDCETGPNEIISPGENGLLVPVNNIDALADAMRLLSSNVELKQKFRKNARNSVRHLELSKIADSWLKLKG